jgi:hypothetical protein
MRAELSTGWALPVSRGRDDGHRGGMIRSRIVAIGVLLATLTGCGVDGPFTVQARPCANVRGDVESSADEVLVAVTADDCRSVDGSLLSEGQSFDALGHAAWQTPGPEVNLIAITLGRSANRPVGDQPRQLVLTSQQAIERWGHHPVLAAAETHGDFVRLAWGVGLLLAVVAALLLGSGLFIALVGCLRRGEIVLIWFLR